MINLLSPQQKKEIIEEQRYRLFSILGVLAVLFLVVLSLALFSIKTYISGKAQSEKILIPAQLQGQEEQIREINEKLQKLNSFYGKQVSFSGILEKVSKILPRGIRLASLSSETVKSGDSKISLQGFSPTRDLLLQLKKDLESESGFRDINFPPSNWVKAENIDFSVNFHIALP